MLTFQLLVSFYCVYSQIALVSSWYLDTIIRKLRTSEPAVHQSFGLSFPVDGIRSTECLTNRTLDYKPLHIKLTPSEG
jgi:hypothetical protein